jgi:hypothetical protein
MQNTRKEDLRAQMQILIIAPLGTEWLQGAVSDAVCFLLNEYPGGKMKVEQHAHTYSSSLDIKGCLKMKEKLGSEAYCCQTEEECLGHVMDCDFRKVILEFDQSGSEYSQVHHRTI